jgi:glutathione S-transferase
MTATLKIYGIPQSRAARCLWAARELGLPHENVPVHFAKTRESPELLKANPNARVPAIDDGGFTLYESMAINLYLTKKYGQGHAIGLRSPEEEALATQWSFWAMTETEKPLLANLLHVFGMQPADDATLAQCKTDLDAPFKVLDSHLATQPWLLGDRFTIADLNAAAVLVWAKAGKLDLSAYPKLADWLGRCMARPAFKG